jgi:hypothetical protein
LSFALEGGGVPLDEQSASRIGPWCVSYGEGKNVVAAVVESALLAEDLVYTFALCLV